MKNTFYMNVYDSDLGPYTLGIIYHSRKSADIAARNSSRRRIACIKVTEGQFDV